MTLEVILNIKRLENNMAEKCENCRVLEDSLQNYAQALHETSKFVAYLLDPRTNDQERARIREELQQLQQLNQPDQTNQGSDSIIQP